MSEGGLRAFVRTQQAEEQDYATAFALACGLFYEMDKLEERFDYYWDRYEVRTLQD